MKTTLMIVVLLLCIGAAARSNNNDLCFASGNSVTDNLASDHDFISSVNAIFTLKLKIQETGSAELLQRSVQGTISITEKQELSTRLGYADYNSLSNHMNNIGFAIVRLKEKYPELNDVTQSAAVINSAVDALADQGKITAINNAVYNFTCLRELYADIVNCIRTSVTVAALNLCIRAALAEFRVCLIMNG